MKNTIKHIGVLGMHWGRRKASQDHTEAKTLKKKSIKELSNKEITKITTRLSLEKQLKSLDEKKNNRAKELVGKLLIKFGPMILSAIMAKYAKDKYDNWRANVTNVTPLIIDGVFK